MCRYIVCANLREREEERESAAKADPERYMVESEAVRREREKRA